MQEAHKLELQDEGIAVPVCIRPSSCLSSCLPASLVGCSAGFLFVCLFV